MTTSQWDIPKYFNIGESPDLQCQKGNGEREAFIVYDGIKGKESILMYKGLAHYSSAFAGALTQLSSFLQETRVVIRLPNSLEYPIAFYGVLKAGGIAVPTSTLLTGSEVAYLVSDSQASVIVTDAHMWLKLAGHVNELSNLKIAIITSATTEQINQWREQSNLQILSFEECLAAKPLEKAVETLSSDPAYLVYTSGTTGSPKGVLHAHRALLGRMPAAKYWFDFQGVDRIMHSGKFNWTYVLGSALTDPIYLGHTVIAYEGENRPDIWGELIARFYCTIFIGVPTIYRQILEKSSLNKESLPTLRHCMSAGEHLSDEVITKWRERFALNIYEAIGMSEISYYISQRIGDEIKPGSAGKPQPGHTIKLLDEKTFQEVPHGEDGIIAIDKNDPALFLRYWNLPEETAKVHKNGYFITGDFASFDNDGYVWFKGRKDDIINTFGYRVSPYEIERVLKSHPAVQDCAVLGLEIEINKTLIAACIVPHDDSDSALLKHQINVFAQSHLATYKLPKLLFVCKSFVRNKNGKILRKQLTTEILQRYKLEKEQAVISPRIQPNLRPRRSMLYVAADNVRHIQKATTLPVDSVIFDLQESIAESNKQDALAKLVAMLTRENSFGNTERVIRVNRPEGQWFSDECQALAKIQTSFDALLLPAVEDAHQLQQTIATLWKHGFAKNFPILINIESARGVLFLPSILQNNPQVIGVVMGTTDLSLDLKITNTPNRDGLLYALSSVILTSRAFQVAVIDGPHFTLVDERSCELAARQACNLGFDGKAVVHPIQIHYTNDVFSPHIEQVTRAHEILQQMRDADGQGKTHAVLRGRLVEPSLVGWAQRVIVLYDRISEHKQKNFIVTDFQRNRAPESLF